MKRALLVAATLLLGCPRSTTPSASPPPSPSLELGPSDEAEPARDGPPDLDPGLIAPPPFRPPPKAEGIRHARRTRVSGLGGKPRLSVKAKALGKPNQDGLQWLRLYVDAYGTPKNFRTFATIAVDATGGGDPARAELVRAAAESFVNRIGWASVAMVSLTTAPKRHPEIIMTKGNRKQVLRGIELAGQQEDPAALAPAIGSLSPKTNLVIIAAADHWADDDEGLERVANMMTRLGARAQLLAIGKKVDLEPFVAIDRVHRASSRAEIDKAIGHIVRDVPRAFFLGAGVSVRVPEGMAVLGGRRGGASENNRRAGVQLGDLWIGYRHEADLLVEVDPALEGTQTLQATVHYTYRNPEPGPSIQHGEKTSKVRLRLP